MILLLTGVDTIEVLQYVDTEKVSIWLYDDLDETGLSENDN